MLSAMFTSSNRATMLASDNVAGLEGAAAAAPAPVSVGAGVAAAEVVSVADAFSFPLHAPSATHAISRSDRSVYRRRTSCIRPPDGVETKDGQNSHACRLARRAPHAELVVMSMVCPAAALHLTAPRPTRPTTPPREGCPIGETDRARSHLPEPPRTAYPIHRSRTARRAAARAHLGARAAHPGTLERTPT